MLGGQCHRNFVQQSFPVSYIAIDRSKETGASVLDCCAVHTIHKYVIYFLNYWEDDVGFYVVNFQNLLCLAPCLLILCDI
jgi:hypothetical protein